MRRPGGYAYIVPLILSCEEMSHDNVRRCLTITIVCLPDCLQSAAVPVRHPLEELRLLLLQGIGHRGKTRGLA